MKDINWLLTILIASILSIPFQILTNLLTPKIQKFLEKRSISSKGKSLKQIKDDYNRIKELHDNPHLMELQTYFHLLYGLYGVIYLLFFWIVTLISTYFAITSKNESTIQISTYTALFFAFLSLLQLNTITINLRNSFKDIRRIKNFIDYEKVQIEKIKELESLINKKT